MQTDINSMLLHLLLHRGTAFVGLFLLHGLLHSCQSSLAACLSASCVALDLLFVVLCAATMQVSSSVCRWGVLWWLRYHDRWVTSSLFLPFSKLKDMLKQIGMLWPQPWRGRWSICKQCLSAHIWLLIFSPRRCPISITLPPPLILYSPARALRKHPSLLIHQRLVMTVLGQDASYHDMHAGNWW